MKVESPPVCKESSLDRLVREKRQNPNNEPGAIDLASTQNPTGTNGNTTPEELNDIPDRIKLKYLFERPEFSTLDGLNEYDDDFTTFVDLSNILTHEMKRSLARSLVNQKNAVADTIDSPPNVSKDSKPDQLDIPTNSDLG